MITIFVILYSFVDGAFEKAWQVGSVLFLLYI